MAAPDCPDLAQVGPSQSDSVADLRHRAHVMPRFRLDQVRDSGDPSAVAALVEAVRSMGGGLDGLWLNAAFATIGPLEETTAGGFDRMMAVNVRGPMLQLAALSPLLNPGASIVVTSSSSTYEGAEQTSLYGATKGATIAMVRSWARQLAPRRIRCALKRTTSRAEQGRPILSSRPDQRIWSLV